MFRLAFCVGRRAGSGLAEWRRVFWILAPEFCLVKKFIDSVMVGVKEAGGFGNVAIGLVEGMLNA
jgi:hypothetical protein